MAVKKYFVNDEIPYKEVFVVTDDGVSYGTLGIKDALRRADQEEKDLVLISEGGKAPVCKITDYGKFIYNMQKKEKANKKSQGELKEIRLSISISDHDLETKVKSANKFLESGNKVRAVVRFKGREIVMVDKGRQVMDSFISKTKGIVEKLPEMEGRTLVCTLKKR